MDDAVKKVNMNRGGKNANNARYIAQIFVVLCQKVQTQLMRFNFCCDFLGL